MNKYKTKNYNSQVGTIKSNSLTFLKIINVKLVKFFRKPDFLNSILNTKISLSNYNSKTFTYYLEHQGRRLRFVFLKHVTQSVATTYKFQNAKNIGATRLQQIVNVSMLTLQLLGGLR